MKVYLSGPMTGVEVFNYPGFIMAASDLRDLGFEVVNPVEMKDPVTKPNDIEYNRRQYLARNIERILSDDTIDAVVVLPGWQDSRGAVLELHVAQYIGMKVFPLSAVLAAGDKVKAEV